MSKITFYFSNIKFCKQHKLFECKNINFDSKELRKKLEKIDQDIQKTDFEISKLNSIEFEI